MKTATIIAYLTLFLITLFSSCEKEENQDSDNHGGNGTHALQFENFNYVGNLLITFTDGISKSIEIKNGKLDLPINAGGSKTIKTIQLNGHQPILIGRKENENIKLKFQNNVLVHRDPVDGFIPIGTYAEFQLINLNKTTLSQNYQLEADLDLMNEEWTPIGNNESSRHFSSVFEGNNHEIHNLKITNSVAGHPIGLFGRAQEYVGKGSEIRNLTIRSGMISIMNESVHPFVGAIVGLGHKVINCISYCHITANSTSVGGIAASATEVSNCHNYGNIEVHGGASSVGGILGFIWEQSINIKIDNCSNHGDITLLDGGGNLGGIVGSLTLNDVTTPHFISNCKNTGRITNNRTGSSPSGSAVGGIAGRASNLINCENTGAVTSVSEGKLNNGDVGGIAGYAINVQNSKNSGKVKGGYRAGGIAGAMVPYSKSVSSNNANLGDVEGILSAGGIAGEVGELALQANYNKGNITAKEHVGGIVGKGYWANSISNCYNTGNITGESSDRNFPTFVGGIISSDEFIGVLQNNYNIGKIYNNSPQENSKSFGIGPAFGLTAPFTNYLGNFWKDHPDDAAKTAFSPSTHQDNSVLESLSFQFSATAWPQWDVTATDWKSMGSWNNANPVYPKLHFEE